MTAVRTKSTLYHSQNFAFEGTRSEEFVFAQCQKYQMPKTENHILN